MVAVQTPDEKVTLRDYLETHQRVIDVIGPTERRVVLSFDDVTSMDHWIVLQRAGGTWDREVPIYRPVIYMTAYGGSPWEALRLINAANMALGIDDPGSAVQIEGTGIIITDIQAEAGITEGKDNRVPVTQPVPFMLQPLRLTTFRLAL